MIYVTTFDGVLAGKTEAQLDMIGTITRKKIKQFMERRDVIKNRIETLEDNKKTIGWKIAELNLILSDISKERGKRKNPNILAARKKREENRCRPGFILEMLDKGVSLSTIAGAIGVTERRTKELISSAKRISELDCNERA